MIIAETSRLILRYFTPDDINALFLILSDPEVMRYSIGGVKTRSQTADFLDLILYFYHQHNFGLYALITKETKQLIGFSGLLPWTFEGKKEIEIGYRLARQFWNQGLATEAAIAVKNHAWQTLKIKQLFCLIDPENIRSIRVAKKLGMVYQKRIIFQSLNLNVYSLLIANC